MKRFRIKLRPAAIADLIRLFDYIEAESGAIIAKTYIERVEAACHSLADFPHRGTKRDDLQPGIRTIGFERRVTIAFQVLDAEVDIVGIFYGGRDFEQHLRSPDDQS